MAVKEIKETSFSNDDAIVVYRPKETSSRQTSRASRGNIGQRMASLIQGNLPMFKQEHPTTDVDNGAINKLLLQIDSARNMKDFKNSLKVQLDMASALDGNVYVTLMVFQLHLGKLMEKAEGFESDGVHLKNDVETFQLLAQELMKKADKGTGRLILMKKMMMKLAAKEAAKLKNDANVEDGLKAAQIPAAYEEERLSDTQKLHNCVVGFSIAVFMIVILFIAFTMLETSRA